MKLLHAACIVTLLAVCAFADTDSPPYISTTPGTQNNLDEIYRQFGNHRHIGSDGSSQIPPEAAAIDNAIVSDFRGQIVFNSTDFEWCGSTQTASSTAWVKLQAPTTPCGH